ncbi:MAG: hypothetical protein ABW033_05920 [Acidimicrobiia bacterium]
MSPFEDRWEETDRRLRDQLTPALLDGDMLENSLAGEGQLAGLESLVAFLTSTKPDIP